MFDPFISVVIPTHNRAGTVINAVESVLNQSYSHFELIVIDDASTDNSFETLKNRFGDQIKLFAKPHAGVSASRNLGVHQSQGDWIAFLDSDDIWHKKKLEDQITYHQNNPGLKISQTQEVWIRHGKQVSARKKHQKPSGYIFPQSLDMCLISPSSVILTRDLFESNEGFDENLLTCEDYDLWLKITSKNDIGLLDSALLTKYGGHEDQLSHRYHAIDRFRIYSLLKIILLGQLSNTQKNQAITAAKKKLHILQLGAQKRDWDFAKVEALAADVFTSVLSMDDFLEMGKALLLNDGLFRSG